MKAMIFAAGLGTRLKPLTDTLPKALVPVCGKPLIEHVARKLRLADINEAVVNVHYFADKIEKWIEEQPWITTDTTEGGNKEKMQISISDERALLLETGGAILHARKWLEGCNATAPLEVVFSNAGIGTGIENEENVRRTFATNVGGNLNVVLPVIDIFRRNAAAGAGSARRQIVLTASIAGYAPLSTCPAYAATKAAVKSWGLSLRGMLKREGIWVNVICPGFVRSRITDRNTCPMPFFMEADSAAKVILDRVDRNIGLIAFPWPMRFGVWLMSALPWRVSEFISGILPEKTSSGRCRDHASGKAAF